MKKNAYAIIMCSWVQKIRVLSSDTMTKRSRVRRIVATILLAQFYWWLSASSSFCSSCDWWCVWTRGPTFVGLELKNIRTEIVLRTLRKVIRLTPYGFDFWLKRTNNAFGDTCMVISFRCVYIYFNYTCSVENLHLAHHWGVIHSPQIKKSI